MLKFSIRAQRVFYPGYFLESLRLAIEVYNKTGKKFGLMYLCVHVSILIRSWKSFTPVKIQFTIATKSPPWFLFGVASMINRGYNETVVYARTSNFFNIGKEWKHDSRWNAVYKRNKSFILATFWSCFTGDRDLRYNKISLQLTLIQCTYV